MRMFGMGYDIDNRFQKPDLLSAWSYRRRLPHLRVDGGTYFINFNIAPGKRDFAPDERTIVFDAFQFFHLKRYRLHAACVMNDHVHVVARIFEGIDLSSVTHSWKSFTANRLQREHGRSFDVWQDESEDHVVRDWFELLQKTLYVLDNPNDRWPGIRDYAWVKFYGFDGVGAEACPSIEDIRQLLESMKRSDDA
jgi:hypothetical protein